MEKNNHYKEKEKSSKEEVEKNIKKEKLKQLEFKKTKEKISIEIESEKLLTNLKDLIEKGEIKKEDVNKILSNIELDNQDIINIFEKIDEIENIDNIDNILPKSLRISIDDYKKAINDRDFRENMIAKINDGLAYISEQIKPSSSIGTNLFGGYLFMLDKNLILVQENNIDIKSNLSNKHKGEKKISFFDNLIKIFKVLLDKIKNGR